MIARTTFLVVGMIFHFLLASEEVVCFQGSTPQIQFLELTTLGGKEKSQFIEAGMVAAAPKGGVYVTGKMRQLINKYDSNGGTVLQLQKEERMKAKFGVGPYQISVSGKNVAAVDYGSRLIKLFDLELHFLEDIVAPGSVMDVSFVSDDFLYIAFITTGQDGVLTKYSLRRKAFSDVILRNARGGSFFDMNCCDVDSKGRLVVAYTYKNRVEVIGRDSKPLLDFSIPCLKDSATLRRIELNDGQVVDQVPDGTIFRDVAVSPNGIIFLLGGDAAELPYQTIYAVNSSGKLVSKANLPKRSGLIYIDRTGYLYTREDQRKTIKKYRVVFSGL